MRVYYNVGVMNEIKNKSSNTKIRYQGYLHCSLFTSKSLLRNKIVMHLLLNNISTNVYFQRSPPHRILIITHYL